MVFRPQTPEPQPAPTVEEMLAATARWWFPDRMLESATAAVVVAWVEVGFGGRAKDEPCAVFVFADSVGVVGAFGNHRRSDVYLDGRWGDLTIAAWKYFPERRDIALVELGTAERNVALRMPAPAIVGAPTVLDFILTRTRIALGEDSRRVGSMDVVAAEAFQVLKPPAP